MGDVKTAALLQAAVAIYINDERQHGYSARLTVDDACALARQFWFKLEGMEEDQENRESAKRYGG